MLESAAVQSKIFQGTTIDELFEMVAMAERRAPNQVPTLLVYESERGSKEVLVIDERFPFLLGAA